MPRPRRMSGRGWLAGLAASPDSGSTAGRVLGAESSDALGSRKAGAGAGLVVSLTSASLVPMMDNFTPPPFAAELSTAGVPDEMHDWLGQYGVGALVVKL